MKPGPYAPGTEIRHKFHPEWGIGTVTSCSPSLVVAVWQYHVQGFALPLRCVETAALKAKGVEVPE